MPVFIDDFSWERPDNEKYVRLKTLSLGDKHFSDGIYPSHTMQKLFYDGWMHPGKSKKKIQVIRSEERRVGKEC